MKKAFIFLMAAVMALALVPATALAAEATVNDLAGLQAALADPTVDTITVSGDITLSGTITVSRDITIRGAAGSAQPVITGAASGVMFSCTGGHILTLDNLNLKLGADGNSFMYLADAKAVVTNCLFDGAAGVTYGYNLIMGAGSSHPVTTVEFIGNTVNLIFRNGINALGNNSIVNNNVFNYNSETYPPGGRTSVLSLIADATSGPIAVRGNTFIGANRALAVDNAPTFPADNLVFENNNFIDTRYAFELSPSENDDDVPYDLSNNYYIYQGVVGPARVQDADSTASALGDFGAELTGSGYEIFITNESFLTEPYEAQEDEPVRTYTVSYHPNGGTGTVPMDMNRYYTGDQVMLKSGAGLTMPGKVFAGWSLTDDEMIQMIPYTMKDSDVTFFAVWVTASDLPEIPKTGDNASLMGFVMIALAAAAAAAVILKKRASAK